jgi:hypothetical protein
VNEQDIALWERRLGDGLNALADDEAPAPRVMVANVIAAGRVVRRRRRRTVFALCAVLVAATALTFGAVTAVSRGGSVSQIPAAPSDTDPGITAAPTASLASGSDPAVGIRFGWLPSETIGAYEVSRQVTGPDHGGEPVIAANTGNAPNGLGYSSVLAWSSKILMTATIFPPGDRLDPAGTYYPAGTVLGHQAQWAVFCSKCSIGEGGLLDLVWQYAPGTWASVSYSGETSTAIRGVVQKVAANLVIDKNVAYAMPFHLAKLPAGLHTDQVLVSFPKAQNPQVGTAQLLLCATSPCDDMAKLDGGLLVSQQTTTRSTVGSSTYQPGITVPDAPSTAEAGQPITIDGKAGRIWVGAKGASISFPYDYTYATISAADAEYQAIGGKVGLIAFADSLTWYGPDPSHWTTDVIG